MAATTLQLANHDAQAEHWLVLLAPVRVACFDPALVERNIQLALAACGGTRFNRINTRVQMSGTLSSCTILSW